MVFRHTLAVLAILFSQLYSVPADAAWEQQYELFGNGNTVVAIAAGGGKNAVAFGQKSEMGSGKPLLLVTKDGTNWTESKPPGDFAFMLTLSMPDENYVYGGGLGMYQSSDGGSTWKAITLPGGGGMFTTVERLHAIDPVHVYAVSEANVFYTPNSLNWESTKATIDDVTLSAVFFASSQLGWVAGGKKEEIIEEDWEGNEIVVGYDIKPKGIVMQTTDGGKNFLPLVIGANEYFRHITFVNDSIGWAVASSNDNPYYLKKTTDSGTTWIDVQLPSMPDGEWLVLSRIVFTSPLEAWAAGAIGDPEYDLDNMSNKAVVIHTGDGGMSWDFDGEAESSGGYMDIDFANPHFGWAVGTFGKIMAFTDGTEWVPPDLTGDDIVEQPGDDGMGQEDVFSWGTVFGVFSEEDVLIGENSYPGGSGGGINVGIDDPKCSTETRHSGCRTGPRSIPGTLPVLLLLLAIIVSLRGRASGIPAAMVLVLLTAACGQDKEVKICEEPDLAEKAPLSDITDDGLQLGSFSCGPTSASQPIVFGGTEARLNDRNNYIAFVRQHEEGGSDLFLLSSDGQEEIQLTEFNDPKVTVRNPSWSPDRKAIAFGSDFRQEFNDKRLNVFVIALDRSACYQLTPSIAETRFSEDSKTATLTGTFRYGQGAIASPVGNAIVGHPALSETALTGPGGEFSLTVPAGAGTIVMRGEVNGIQVKGLADYSAEAGTLVDLEPTNGSVESLFTINRLHWSNSGAQLFAFVSEKSDSLFAIETTSGEASLYLQLEEDKVVVFAPLPEQDLAVVAMNSDPTLYSVYSLSETPEVIYQFTFDGQTADSLVSVSPMRFLATLQGESLLLFGADSTGALATHEITPDNLSGLIPGQLDWSLTGTHLIATVEAAGKTNLMLIDVNARIAKALTTDGRSSMPAWYGL
jgi:photosystem II stability/assembly factor-like uncharacterized protein